MCFYCYSFYRKERYIAFIAFLLCYIEPFAQIEFECHTEIANQEVTACWPDNVPPCESTINYAPDSHFPEHTPIKYIKFVLHVFQNSNAVFPPGNYTNSPEHLDVLRSWFHHPTKGINARLSNLCDPQPKVPGNESPHIPDSRMRFIFDGVENQEVFIAIITILPDKAPMGKLFLIHLQILKIFLMQEI